ncbi:HIRAN domain-containing protein [Streptococcus sp. 596553]|uniref:HIRAN domain-containing protein n=1 Tax=unclassified Streptococcus TaxID=2608887 RepID=UPI000DD81648|nr:HIRAN domain-containing protein [Streptococcus sp. 596553]
MQKTVEKILFRVAGVTKYKKAVKEACNLIAEDNGIPEYAKYYSNLSTKELREELEEYGMKVFKYQDLDFFNIELVPEVDNKYDPNAIKVLIFNNHVGYVPATVAKTIRKYFDNKKYNFVIEGEIKGGPYKEWDDLNDKVITNNDLDIGFEIYLSVIDSTLEESNEVSPTTPIENVVHKKTEKESSELALDVHEIDLREKEEQRNIEPVLTSDALELKKESDLVQLSKPTIPIEGNALNIADSTQFTTSVETTPKKESPTIKSIILSIVGLLFLLASLSLLFEGKIGPFFIGLIISYILIRPIIKYIKK